MTAVPCIHCRQPDDTHTERVDDQGRIHRTCPTGPAPQPTDRDEAKSHIARIRAQLQEDR